MSVLQRSDRRGDPPRVQRERRTRRRGRVLRGLLPGGQCVTSGRSAGGPRHGAGDERPHRQPPSPARHLPGLHRPDRAEPARGPRAGNGALGNALAGVRAQGAAMLAALQLLIDMHRSAKREVPPDAPMPFRKDWRRLVLEGGQPNRRLYETAVLATLRDKLRSGDIWVERSSSYRRFDSYLLPSPAVPAVAAELGLPATAGEWLSTKGAELDRRLKRFARRLQRGELEGIEYRDGRLQVSPVKATVTPEGRAFADGIEAMMPRVRITELLHEVNRATGFASAFTNLRTGERCDDGNALLAAILADAT